MDRRAAVGPNSFDTFTPRRVIERTPIASVVSIPAPLPAVRPVPGVRSSFASPVGPAVRGTQSSSPSGELSLADDRSRCKPRPEPRRGGGQGRGFIPWCGKGK